MTGDPLDEPLGRLVGPRAAKALAGLGLATVGDLLRHYPRRYETRGQLSDLAHLRVGDQVTVLARVADVRLRDLGPRRRPRWIVEARVTDGVGSLQLTFFNQRHQVDRLRIGKVGLFAGTVGIFRDQRQLLHPDYELLDADPSPDGPDADPLAGMAAAESFANRLIPVYPATEKVPSWQIARAVATVLPHLDGLVDPLDEALRRRYDVIGLAQALEWKHRPLDWRQVGAADRRLRWDEALGVQLVLALGRAAMSRAPAKARPARRDGIAEAFDARMPFELTQGQRDVGEVIEADLSLDHPMHRLLQGEVGSGKTVVALRAMLQVVDAGGQAALLAPTEVLAAQHARTIADLLGPLAQGGMLGGDPRATRVALLTGSMGAAARRSALLDAASGQAGLVVGTHALLQEQVQFADLGLVVVDEQHRFGVAQRATLVERGDAMRPHTLVMTATPIPRTVAMTVFGELDISTLAELPAGRPPAATHVVPALERPAHLDRAWQRAREEVAAGRQVYVVCPRIDADSAEATDDPADGGPAKGAGGPAAGAAVATVLPSLSDGPLSGLRLAALTGRMAAVEKDDVMARFVDPGRPDGVDVLVATTVIEVGVDVPNATMMVVLDADRFGISQLHQLRGRVRRGRHPGLCLLVTNAPPDSAARARLTAVAETDDGFALSRVDLEARSEGDVLGAAQSGARRALRLLSVLRDEEVIVRARQAATDLVAEDPSLSRHPLLASQLAGWLDDDQAEYLVRT